jgi:hypothetical protein
MTGGSSMKRMIFITPARPPGLGLTLAVALTLFLSLAGVVALTTRVRHPTDVALADEA